MMEARMKEGGPGGKKKMLIPKKPEVKDEIFYQKFYKELNTYLILKSKKKITFYYFYRKNNSTLQIILRKKTKKQKNRPKNMEKGKIMGKIKVLRIKKNEYSTCNISNLLIRESFTDQQNRIQFEFSIHLYIY